MIVEYKVLQEVFNKFYFDKNFLPQPPRCLPVIEQYTTRGKFERLIECCVYTLIQIGCLMRTIANMDLKLDLSLHP
ncbi:hypothetical protein CMV_019622 [Castanea mollissima]|uniref:Uncharacterized protein n=1 Tax=Castanea mollissima TaxID=60419 RepID=A0A8J4VEE4_9ROSI|nr:hypothetical protein CMV_019622 [Castanea mollissima]